MSKTTKPAKKKMPAQNQEIVILMLKLISGESIIGKVYANDESNIILKDVVETKSINYPTNGGIAAACYYSEWFPGTSSEHYLLNKSHIVCAAAPSPRVVKLYVENLVKQNLRKHREKFSNIVLDDDDESGD